MNLEVNAGIRLILSLSKDEASTGRAAASSFALRRGLAASLRMRRLRTRPNERRVVSVIVNAPSFGRPSPQL